MNKPGKTNRSNKFEIDDVRQKREDAFKALETLIT